jgi:chemotaxis protein MotB
MARQMLIKGGFDDARIGRIEGLAERDPRRADDPLAAENRRIEILVRDKPAPMSKKAGAR